GDTPYGVLPVTSRELWDAPDAPPEAKRLAALLKQRGGDPVADSKAPRIAPGGDPDEQLVTVLGLAPTSTQYRIRHGAGQELLRNWANFLKVDDVMEEFATPQGA